MKRPLCLVALFIAAAVFMYLEFFSEALMCDPYSDLDGTSTEIVGTVSSREYRRDYQGQILPVLYLIPEDSSGNLKYIQCYMDSADGYVPMVGEKVKVAGKIRYFQAPTNPGEFNSRLYYSTLKISYRLVSAQVVASGGNRRIFKEALCRLKLKLEEGLDYTLPQEDAALMKAILLGDKAYMDQEVKRLYQDCGVIHIMAVSGMHVYLLAMGIFMLLRKLNLNRSIASAICIAVIYGYGCMCGMSTSSFRAILMFVIRLLAPEFKRTYDILSALALSGILLVLEQPLYLYNSGFWFSFGAIIGIAFLRPTLFPVFINNSEKMQFADQKKSGIIEIIGKKIAENLITAFSVFLITLPVYVSFYHTYPVSSFLLNLIVLPLMAPLMLAGSLCMLAGISIPVMGVLPAGVVRVILGLFDILCKGTSFWPLRTWYIGHSGAFRIILYLGILVIFMALRGRPRIIYRKKAKNKNRYGYVTDISRYILIPVAIIILCFNLRPDLKISMIDVGQGDGILIQSKSDVILIDGGSTSKKQVGKYTIIPYLKYEGIGKIHMAVVTHEDQDHISGLLEIMDDMEKGGIRIENLMLPLIADDIKGDNYRELEKRASELGIVTTYISENKQFYSADGNLSFTCLNPDAGLRYEGANAYSTVLYLEYGEFSALFTGDVEAKGQENLLDNIKSRGQRYKDIDLLKVAHHGSEYTTDEEFLELTSPGYALISCGKDNSYGHPHKNLLNRLSDRGTVIYRTDESGAVTVNVFKNSMTIETFLP